MKHQLPGDEWQHCEEPIESSTPTRRDIIRYSTMKDKLLVTLPWYTSPVACQIISVLPNYDAVMIQVYIVDEVRHWATRDQIRVLGIIPNPPQPQAPQPQPLDLKQEVNNMQKKIVQTEEEITKILGEMHEKNRQLSLIEELRRKFGAK